MSVTCETKLGTLFANLHIKGFLQWISSGKMQWFDFCSAVGHSKIPLGGILIPLMREPMHGTQGKAVIFKTFCFQSKLFFLI